MSNELVKREESITNINLLNPEDVKKAEVFLARLMKTEKSGIKSIEDGLAVIAAAQELKLPFMHCAQNIHVVNGKTVTGVHVIKALLLRAGVVWKKTKDHTPLYQYTDGANVFDYLPDYVTLCKSAEEANELKDGYGVYPLKHYRDLNGAVFSELEIQGNDKVIIAQNQAHAIALGKKGQYAVVRMPLIPVDFVTEYEFTRYQKIHGNLITRTTTSSFSQNDAIVAGFMTKDNYKKYLKKMIDHRAFTFGARDIAPDIVMGCIEETENAVINNEDVDDGMFTETTDVTYTEVVED